MPSKPKDMSALLAAATALDDALRQYDELAHEAMKVPVNSEKNLARAARTMKESAECQERIGVSLRALLEAVDGARVKQQTSLERLVAHAKGIEARAEVLRQLMGRFQALGEKAKELNVSVGEIVTKKSAGADAQEILGALGGVEAKMTEVVDEAEALTKDAKEGDFVDVAREADSLRQQVQAARNKVMNATRSVAEKAPS